MIVFSLISGLGMELKALCVLSKYSIVIHIPNPLVIFFIDLSKL